MTKVYTNDEADKISQISDISTYIKDLYQLVNDGEINPLTAVIFLKELEKKDASPKISDMIGKDDESELHHKEAMKERFNVDNSIKTHVETAKSAREQYAKTVSKISDDPQEWSNINNTMFI